MKKIEYILHKINHKEEPEECEYRGPQEVPEVWKVQHGRSREHQELQS